MHMPNRRSSKDDEVEIGRKTRTSTTDLKERSCQRRGGEEERRRGGGSEKKEIRRGREKESEN
jgi:hypothetical protein